VIAFLVFFRLLSGHHLTNRLVEISGPDGERRRTTAKISVADHVERLKPIGRLLAP